VCEGPLKIARRPARFYETHIKYQWLKRGYNADRILDFGLRWDTNTANQGKGNFLGMEGVGRGAAHPLNLVPKLRALL